MMTNERLRGLIKNDPSLSTGLAHLDVLKKRMNNFSTKDEVSGLIEDIKESMVDEDFKELTDKRALDKGLWVLWIRLSTEYGLAF